MERKGQTENACSQRPILTSYFFCKRNKMLDTFEVALILLRSIFPHKIFFFTFSTCDYKCVCICVQTVLFLHDSCMHGFQLAWLVNISLPTTWFIFQLSWYTN